MTKVSNFRQETWKIVISVQKHYIPHIGGGWTWSLEGFKFLLGGLTNTTNSRRLNPLNLPTLQTLHPASELQQQEQQLVRGATIKPSIYQCDDRLPAIRHAHWRASHSVVKGGVPSQLRAEWTFSAFIFFPYIHTFTRRVAVRKIQGPQWQYFYHNTVWDSWNLFHMVGMEMKGLLSWLATLIK